MSDPEAVSLADQRFRQLLDAAPDAILEVDSAGLIVLLNQAAEQLFGYPRAELLGQAVEILIPQAIRAQHMALRQGYQAAPVVRPMGSGRELEAQRKDGSRFRVEISLSPVPFGDRLHFTAIIRDVSERRRAEDRLREIQERHARELANTNAQLESRNIEIERANRLKSEFLASMSHELRTPLHTIIGFSELLGEGLEGELNPTQRRFVEHIHRDSLHLLELINDILDLSKIEAGRLDLRCSEMPLEGALQEVLATIRPQAAAKSQRLRVSAVDDLVLEADRVRVKEILYNLLSNAVKFTGEGGAISITVEPAGEFAAVAVADSGVGISGDQHAAVFDAFHQVGSTTKGLREGTGLGLAITRHLVEQHGGRLTLQSEPGRGSCFRFTIPLANAQRAPRARALVIAACEDRPRMESLAQRLADAGYQVALSSQARDVLSLAARLRPNYVLLGPRLVSLRQRLTDLESAGAMQIVELGPDPTPDQVVSSLGPASLLGGSA